MGVYTVNESSYAESVEAIIPTTDNLMEASMQIAYESTINYNNIMKAVGIQEANYLAETGQELVYEGATGEGFFGKLKAFFVKIWQKIKGLFTKFMALINSYTKSDKDFLSKYRKQLSSGTDISKMKYSGYKFTLDEISISDASARMKKSINDAFGLTIGDSLANYKEFADLVNDHITTQSARIDFKDLVDAIIDKDEVDTVEELRGTALDANTSYDASEFSKELFSKLRNGEDSKQELENMKLGDYTSWLETSKTSKDNADKAYNSSKKFFDDAIKYCEKLSREVATASAKKTGEIDNASKFKQYENGPTNTLGSTVISLISKYTSLVKSAANILSIMNGALLTAIKDQSRQAKAICVKALTFKPKNESVDLFGDDYHSGSLLENVKLI